MVGERSESIIAHIEIGKSLALAQRSGEFNFEWIPTLACEAQEWKGISGIWCVPGSPYASMGGALNAIRIARENQIPFLGTCGGFQHALLEYARNVLKLGAAEHEETCATGEMLLVSRLSCSLVESSGRIVIRAGTRLHEIYTRRSAMESYHCNFGLNPRFEKALDDGQLIFSARDVAGEVRAFELRDHPFFIGTLFQPERHGLRGEVHPLLSRFIQAARGF